MSAANKIAKSPEEKMVEKFQCPGCVSGSDTSCGVFKLNTNFGAVCTSHCLGASMFGGGGPLVNLALGLPKGFNRASPDLGDASMRRTHNRMEIRLWTKGTQPKWDNLNVAVWALVEDGHLFVRTLAPRIGRLYVDVVEGGTLALVPHAIDVSKFLDEID